MKKSLITVSLLASALLLAFTACGEEKQPETKPEDSTSPKETEETAEPEPYADLYAQLPIEDYDQYVFRIVGDGTKEYSKTNGERIHDDYYNRSRTVEERLNIQITTNEMFRLGNDDNYMNYATSLLSGEDASDLIMTHSGWFSKYILQPGYVLDMTDYMDYFNMDAPWWNKSATENLTLGNQYYYLVGDVNLSHISTRAVLVFNKELCSRFDLELPYQTVRDGKWTVDELYRYVKEVVGDENGDGVLDDNDRFGISSYVYESSFAFVQGCGAAIFEKDNDDIPYVIGLTERLQQTMEKYHDMFTLPNYAFTQNSGSAYIDLFKSGRLLFSAAQVQTLNKFRDIEADYGIVPFPKFDENQEAYITFGTNTLAPAGVPFTVTDPDRSSVVLENLTAETFRQVREDYYADMLENKYVRDEESIEMLRLIFASETRYELEHVFYWGQYSEQYANIIKAGGEGLSSFLAAGAKSTVKVINNTLDALGIIH